MRRCVLTAITTSLVNLACFPEGPMTSEYARQVYFTEFLDGSPVALTVDIAAEALAACANSDCRTVESLDVTTEEIIWGHRVTAIHFVDSEGVAGLAMYARGTALRAIVVGRPNPTDEGVVDVVVDSGDGSEFALSVIEGDGTVRAVGCMSAGLSQFSMTTGKNAQRQTMRQATGPGSGCIAKEEDAFTELDDYKLSHGRTAN